MYHGALNQGVLTLEKGWETWICGLVKNFSTLLHFFIVCILFLWVSVLIFDEWEKQRFGDEQKVVQEFLCRLFCFLSVYYGHGAQKFGERMMEHERGIWASLLV